MLFNQLPNRPHAALRAQNRISAGAERPMLRVVAEGDTAEIFLYSEIGYWGIDAQTFADTLNAHRGKAIVLRINSPGGDVFDGLAMYSLLASWPLPVSVQVDGLAASAASIVMLGGNSIAMARGSFVMIHNAWGIAVGNASDMRDFAGVLDQIDGELAGLYAIRTGKMKDEMLSLMAAESWFNADQAFETKLIDKIVESPAAQAHVAPGLYRNAPKELSASDANGVRRRQMQRLDLMRRSA